MTGSYMSTLPNVFGQVVTSSPEEITKLVNMLLNPDRDDVPNGSSFAVTVDGHNGDWNLWLSDVSTRFIEAHFENLKGN